MRHPPARPTLIYDGQCRFCTCQVDRLRQRTGDAVDYVSSNTSEVRRQFPEIPREHLDRALQFISADGNVYEGAHGMLQALTISGRFQWLLRLYERSRFWSVLLEFGYRWVAANRRFLGRRSTCPRGRRA